ncbi:unnamed protein product, partial [Hapterophycus canaliculatus]
MEPFDAELFVDRLVEDDEPLPWRSEMSGADGGRPHHIWEAATHHTGSGSSAVHGGAKLFLQPVYSWPDQRQPPLQQQQQQQQQEQQPRPMCGDGVQHEPSQDMPIVIPMFDTLFTPCRAMRPEQRLAVTSDFGFGSAGEARSGSNVFEFGPVYNIPPPPETFAPPLQVPMAPLRQPSGGRLGGGLYPPGSGEMTLRRPAGEQHHDSEFKYVANSDLVRGAASALPLTLTGADAHSSREYDDERYAFLRRQEAALFVGAGYLSTGAGRASGAEEAGISPAERASAVDWLSKLHSAAPAASGGARAVCGGGGGGLRGGGGGGGAGPRPTLKLAAAACLALSSKYQDTQAVSLWGVAAAAASVPGTFSASSATSVQNGATRGGDSGGPGVGSNGSSSNRNISGCDGGGDFFRVLGLGGGGGGENSSSSCGGGGDDDNIDVGAARKKLVTMETQVASALGFRLTVPTPLSFLGVFLRRAETLGYLLQQQQAAGGGAGSAAERVREEAQQILLCMLREACSLEHSPSSLAACALYWASCVTSPGAAPPSSFAFLAVTGYELEQLCRCLRDMEGVRTGGGVAGGTESSALSHPYFPSIGAGGGGGG